MRNPNRLALWIIILTLSFYSFALAQNSQELRPLDPDQQVERIKALAAALAAVRTEEEGVALLVKEPELVTPELWKQLNDLGRPESGEQVMITHRLALRIAEQSQHKLGIATSLSNIGATHRSRNELKPALEFFQKSLLLAQAVSEKGLVATLLGNVGEIYRQQGRWSQSLEYHHKSLKAFEELENNSGIATALGQVGLVYKLQGDLTQATDYLRRSLKLHEELANKGGMAFALVNIAEIERLQGDKARGLDYAQRSLKLYREIGSKRGVARTLAELGLIADRAGDYTQALEYLQKSLQLLDEVGDRLGVSFRLINIGEIQTRQGDYAAALKSFQRNMAINEALGSKRGTADALHNIGRIYWFQGNYAQALESFNKRLMLSEEIGDKAGIASGLHYVGIIHYKQGNHTLAMQFFQRDLKLREEVGNKMRVADTLNTIGIIHYEEKQYAPALEYFQKSLVLMEEIGNKQGIALVLSNIGELHSAQGKYAQAQDFLQKSLKFSEVIEKRIFVGMLGTVGEVYRLQGDHRQALGFAVRSADMARQIGQREALWIALTTVGQSYRATNDLVKARLAYEEAIQIVESIRMDIAGEEARTSYFTKAQKLYELYGDLLMELHRQRPSEGHDAAALQASERARARSLLEILTEARADIRQGVDPGLLDRERVLRQRFNAAAESQTRLLSDKHTEEQVAKAKKEIDALTAEFREVQAQIRLRSPRYAALTQPEPLGLKEIQALLDTDTLLLEYALGDERSYLWAIGPTSIKSFELPKRTEIEKEVRLALGLLSDGKQWSTSDKVATEYAAVASRLSGMLLDPVVAQIKGKRLLIVGDGALQYLPFGALPSPKSNVQRPTSSGPTARPVIPISVPLIVDHEIVSLPSASTLAILRRETANRARPTKSIAVLADPVFERDDERLSVNRLAEGAKTANAITDINSKTTDSRYLLERAFGVGLQPVTGEGEESREILRIPRLPFTRREAEAILAIAPAGEGMKALDFRASRETATNPEIGQYRIVHFATHGLLNSEHPELSGIVLSLVNEKGQPVDGFLRLHEIYNLKLSADMVVLSACQTGLGKEIRGEGLVGLTRGFMYAGSPRVVASLWKIADAATAELMKKFYQGMLTDKLTPAAALRAAKVEMWKQKRWKAPFYWAAFELQGEWK